MSPSRFDAAVYAHRLRAAAEAAADAGLAGLVITPGYDLRYLIGSRAETFERLTALVVRTSGEPTVVLPRLELASLKQSAVVDLGVSVRDWVDGEDPYALVVDALGGSPVATAVTDAMPALHLLPLTAQLGVLPVLATDVLRTRVSFSHLNLMDATGVKLLPPMHAIFCRNVLIYLEPRARLEVVPRFFDRLVPGGLLFLGHSESLINESTAFELVQLEGDLAYRKP